MARIINLGAKAMNWKKFFIGACLLALTGTAPQVSAVEVFGEEFEQQETQSVEENHSAAVEEVQPVVEEPAPVEVQTPQTESQDLNSDFDDEDLGDDLNFDDLNRIEVEKPQIEEVPPPEVSTVENPTQVKPTPSKTSQINPPKQPSQSTQSNQSKQAKSKLKLQKPRFVKLTMDDSYIYYLDKQAVTWKRMPYSSSEYMADVWIRMVERNDEETEYPSDEIAMAAEQGKQLPDSDIEVLQHRKYYLEHYYLRPKTEQIQFLSELEIMDRPQNTSNERSYDYQNWEYLVPGSMESIIYRTVIQTIGTSKASERGHMTFTDMLEEYGRISIR